MNMNGMNFESKRQELASRLVEREVYYCVSSLVSTLSVLAQNCGWTVLRDECLSWEDDILPLLESINYEEALRAWVMDTDGVDVQSLESMVEMDGDWEEFLRDKVVPVLGEPAEDLDEWLDDDKDRNEKFRELVFEQLESTSNMEELCREFQVDTDDYRDQVYEHWIVSSWLARKLKARGYVVGELCGLTIYGRTCTGQSMCLDHNMQALSIELWQEEWDEFVKSQENVTC